MTPTVIALTGLAALLALIPTRRLFLAGWSRNGLLTYWLTLTLLALVVAAVPAPARFLVPFLIIAYLMPFVTLRTGMDRLRERLGLPGPSGRAGGTEPPRPVKDVTPPDDLTQG